MKMIEFKSWIPDGDPKVGDLVECNGLVPFNGKLMPFLGAIPLSAGAISSTRALVLFDVLDPAIVNKSFIGTNDKIYRLDSTTLTDVSLSGGYAVASGYTWDWCVYGDKLIMVSLSHYVQALSDIDSGSNFAEHAGTVVTDTSIAFVDSNPDTITDSNNGLAGFSVGDRVKISGSTSNNKVVTVATVAAGTLTLIAGDSLTAEAAGDTVTLKDIPYKCRTACMFKDHLLLGNLGSGAAGKERRIQISAIGDISDNAADLSTGAGMIDLPSFGEELVSLRPLGNYVAAYMTNSVYLLNYFGAPFWITAPKMDIGVGLLGTHAVAQIDKQTHAVLGAKDIYLVQPGKITPMGAGVRRRVIETIHPSYTHRITHYVDRSKKVVVWSYPSASGDGTPDKALVYNYEENRFGDIDLAANCVGNIKSPATVINDIVAMIDTVSLTFDDASWLGGVDYNGVVTDADKKLSYLGGSPVDAYVETGEMDFDDVYLIRHLRPIIERAEGVVTGRLKHRLDDNDSYATTSAVMGANGLVDLLASSRYHKIRLEITGNHAGLRGCKIDTEHVGAR